MKEERNLCDACKTCKNRTRSWVICLEECGYVIDALDRIESERATCQPVSKETIAIETLWNHCQHCKETELAIRVIKEALEQNPKWIPCSERPPEELTPVNITWVNRNPESYYKDIKDKPFSATGVYYKGEWYWYSATCEDYLAEYGRCEWDKIDVNIEITAWMPIAEPYKESRNEHTK